MELKDEKNIILNEINQKEEKQYDEIDIENIISNAKKINIIDNYKELYYLLRKVKNLKVLEISKEKNSNYLIINVNVKNILENIKEDFNLKEIKNKILDNIEIIITKTKNKNEKITFSRTKADEKEIGKIVNNKFQISNLDLELHLEKESRIYYIIHFLKTFFSVNKSNKIYGHLAMIILKKYLESIKEYKDRISEENAYIKGCPIEWDLLILKEGTTKNALNIYDSKDVDTIIEVKASGLFSKNLEKVFSNPLNEIENMENKKIKYLFFSYRESDRWFKIDNDGKQEDKKFFEKFNNKKVVNLEKNEFKWASMEIEFFKNLEKFKNLKTDRNFNIKGRTKAIIVVESQWEDEKTKSKHYEIIKDDCLKEELKW